MGYQGIVADAFLEELDIESKTERWIAILSESGSATYLFELEGKVTAWISYGPCRDHDREGFGEIWGLYVSPSEWRQGQGRELILFAEEIARKSRTTDMALWVLRENLRGRAFYETIGFTPDGSAKWFEIGNEQLEEIRYHKKLAQKTALP